MEVPGFVKNLCDNERNRNENEQAGLSTPVLVRSWLN